MPSKIGELGKMKMSLRDKQIVAGNVKRLRGGMTQKDLAQKAGISWRTFMRIERCEKGYNPPLDVLSRIADALGVSLWVLLKKE
jgi:transcriptional regulator with XRE-family HTH domain